MNAVNVPARVGALVLLAALGLSACGGSGSPADGGSAPEVSRYTETFEGSSTPFANPAINSPPLLVACPAEASGTPLCSYNRITPPPSVKSVLVAITPAPGSEGDDYDMAIYDDQGTLMAASASGGSNESALFLTNGSSYYEVRVQPYTITSTDSSYVGVATESDLVVDNEPACDIGLLSGEEYPVAIGLPGITDGGEEIELSVAVLLDGVSEDLARRVMARAADSYSPLNIKLTVAGVQAAAITSDTSTEIIQQAKDQTGGRPPFGADIAAVFTSRTMQAATGGAGTVLGQADCIGGIRAPYNAYLVATITEEEPFELIPGLAIDVERGPETMAHEIGHLMGAHHHYGNCVEGVSPEDATNGDVSPCDLMFPSVEPLSINFSTFAGAVVRGHAVEFAAP